MGYRKGMDVCIQWDVLMEVVYREGTTIPPINPFPLYFTPPYNLPYTLLRDHSSVDYL